MYIQSTMDGLGKSKFKKLFKKLAKTMAPPHVRMKEMKKAKARKAQAAAYAAAPAAEATPAPQVEPTYYQDPLPQPAPQPQAPQYHTRPMPAPYPVQYAEPQYERYAPPQPSYTPDLSPTMYPSAMPSTNGFPQWYPPETGIEEADGDLPIVPAYEFEARDDGEYDYLEGLSQGGGWMDIFTGAASEAVARAKQKRQQRKVDAQSRQYYDNSGNYTGAGYGGFNMASLMPFAIGIGAYFLLRKKRR